ncbi:hypothetical protein AALP_AA5G125200 [Arabis alpina]|uniref:Uncharacterized protein n=1 Tax=Arabis alpina TaxID=50452 RepID=A0A087GWN2_ARAAL|nr:hypothetical protein AALP_AA5G125200 [Arabis alpina]
MQIVSFSGFVMLSGIFRRFPFAGRLVKVNNHEDNTVSFYIDCNDILGAKFVHAKAESVSVSDFLQPNGAMFLNLLGFSSHFGYNHLVADAGSMWKFLQDWSKICLNGQQENLQPLVLKGWFLDMIDFPVHIPLSEIETAKAATRGETTLTKERVFHFTKRNISYLKDKANGEIGSSDLKISSLQVVLGQLWQSIARHGGLNREEEMSCMFPADFRKRLNPPLVKECFGNVAYTVVATATVGELQGHGLGLAALRISEILRSSTNENYRSHEEDWVRNGNIPRIEVHSKMCDNSLFVSSSPWFEVYDNDFGWGKPIAVRAGPANGIGGKLIVFRGIEEGSIDVHAILTLSLWSDVLVNLLDDVASMENVTTT